MKIHRFIGDFDLSKKKVIVEEIETVKQIRNVLKLEIGEHLVLSNGKGAEVKAQIKEIFSSKVTCEILENIEIKNLKRNVILSLAILKKDNFELAVQKATECGVSQIIPIITERTIKTGLNMERLEKIIKEASEQSGRSIVPEISETLSFTEALEHGKNSDEKIIFNLEGEDYKPSRGDTSDGQSISIFIGPEGGFTEKEIENAKEQGYTVTSLGANVLRGETAAIVATYRAVQGI